MVFELLAPHLFGDLICIDPELRERGLIYEPLQITRHKTPEFDITVKIDSWGFRLSQDNTDVLVLGDSFPFGWGVEEPFPNILGFYNAGIIGRDLKEYTRIYWKHFGYAAKVDRIYLCFYIGNDLVRGVNHAGFRSFSGEPPRFHQGE